MQAHYTASGRTFSGPTRPADAYGAAVWDAGPSLYWRLDDAAGSPTALDRMTGEAGGTYFGRRGHAAGAGRRRTRRRSSIRFAGDRHAGSGRDEPGEQPDRLLRGDLVLDDDHQRRHDSSGSATPATPTGPAATTTGYVYMLDDGTLRYGVWTGAATTVTSPATLQRRHLAPRRGHARARAGMKLFVDGALVGERTGGRRRRPTPATGGSAPTHTWGGATSDVLRRLARRGRRLRQALSAATVAAALPAAASRPPRTSRRPRRSRAGSTGLDGHRSTAGGLDRSGRHDRHLRVGLRGRIDGTGVTASAPRGPALHGQADRHRRQGRADTTTKT